MVGDKEMEIRQVWASILEAEFDIISRLLPHYPFAAFDTEFPGTVYPQSQSSPNPFDVYHTLKRNVDATNIIKLGLTLANARGNVAAVWEFNFKDFSLARGDLHNSDSIELLKKQEIDFAENAKNIIDSKDFRKLLLQSGLTPKPFSPVVTWIGFQCSYDFGYLLKILLGGKELPRNLAVFMGRIERFFGKRVYDLKYMMKNCSGLHGGPEKVATTLDVYRTAGRSHQTGSDSLLTMMTFKKMRNKYYPNLDAERLKCIHGGILHGIEIKVMCPPPVSAPPVFISAPLPPPIMVPQPVIVPRGHCIPMLAM